MRWGKFCSIVPKFVRCQLAREKILKTKVASPAAMKFVLTSDAPFKSLGERKKICHLFFLLLKKDSKKSFSFHFFGKPQKTSRAAKSIDAVEWVALLSLDDAALLPISHRGPPSQA